MNLVIISRIIIALALIFCTKAQAQFSDGSFQSFLDERNELTCGNSDPAFTDWFFGRSRELPPILQKLGQIRDQGPSGQCYALTAADLITEKFDLRVSSQQIADLYYQKTFVGGLQKLVGSNHGGFVGPALKATQDQALCHEPHDIRLKSDPSPESNLSFCQKPALQINSIRYSAEQTGLAQGHTLFPRMDALLNSGRVLGASYQAQIIFAGFPVNAFNGFANHASTIVARHWNPTTKTCDYVIRNSWGRFCTRSAATCVQGYYSVSEKLIDESLQRIEWIP